MDRFIIELDRALRTLIGPARTSRPVPGEDMAEAVLDEQERHHAAALMRVNHTGEVCAQALYQGQALTARRPDVEQALQRAADEESEHLAWTERRILELGGRKSFLNPLWYAGSFVMGALAGRMGDARSLGFLEETERQVEEHLADHLKRLPVEDVRSRAVLEQMRYDENSHGRAARELGAMDLPFPVPLLMRLASRVMTGTAYRI